MRRMRDLARPLSLMGKCVCIVAPPFAWPDELSADMAAVEVGAPEPFELQQTLEDVLSAQGLAADAAEREALVAAAQGLGEEEARRAFYRALAAEDRVGVVLSEKKRRLKQSTALEVVEADSSFGEVGGLDSLKTWLSERSGAFTDAARNFGLPPPRGVLLLGVQGCGKSLSAKAVAAFWRLPLLRLDLAAVFGGGLPPEAALKRALRAAEAVSPCVLWIDEIEKGLAGSDASREGSPEGARVLGSFATWMQEKKAPVLVVATANEVASLPPELLRRGRFDEIFFVDLPDERARTEILTIHVARRGRDPSAYALGSVARAAEHFSGAELEQVVVAGMYRAFGAGRDLSDDDLRRCASEIVPLYRTYEERVKALRAWARDRARPAGRATAVVDLLRGGHAP